MSGLRIAYLHRFGAAQDGSAVHVTELVRHLSARGHSFVSLAPYAIPGGEVWTEDELRERAPSIDVFYVRIHGSKSNDPLTLLRRHHPRAVCVWEVNAPIEEKLLEGLSRFRLWRLNARRRRFAREVDGAIAVSSVMARYARERLGIERTVEIANASDPGRFGPSLREEGRFGPGFTALWAGSGQYAWQALHRLERLAASLPEGIRIAVTADGPSTDRLLHLGRVPHERMPEVMASADAGLCLYEPITYYPEFYFSPLKLYDYLASGLPVIGQDLGQIREVLRATGAGVLTDGSDADLRARLVELAADPPAARAMGQRGREAVLREHHWAKVAERTEEFLHSLRR